MPYHVCSRVAGASVVTAGRSGFRIGAIVMLAWLSLGLPALPAWLSICRAASAGEPPTADPLSIAGSPSTPPAPGWLQAASAVVPGAVLHGAGLWAAGDRDTALRLLGGEGIGLGMMAAGALPLILTDASGQNIDITVSLMVAGSGLFLTTGMADLYGTATGGRAGAEAAEQEPYLEPFFGYAFVHDPQFADQHFSVMRLDARLGRLRVTPEGWVAMNSRTRKMELETAVRLVGARTSGHAPDGSFLDLQAGATYHDFGDDGFSILTTEFCLPMRLDLRRLGRSLAGSFVDFDAGWAFQFFDYGIPGHGLGTDISGQLLMRFGYGLYFGGPESPRGELEVYYDHRHDGFAGGLAVDVHDPNFFGHVGLAGKATLGRGWGGQLDLQLGSAAVAMLGILHDWEGPR